MPTRGELTRSVGSKKAFRATAVSALLHWRLSISSLGQRPRVGILRITCVTVVLLIQQSARALLAAHGAADPSEKDLHLSRGGGPAFRAGVSAALSVVLHWTGGLRHSRSRERDSSPIRTFPSERTRRSAGESASGENVLGRPTFLARHAGPGRANCQMARWSLRTPMMCQSVKPKQRPPDAELRWRLDTSPRLQSWGI
jgi:hypothetical protein